MFSKIKHNSFFQFAFRMFLNPINKVVHKKKRIVLYSTWGFRDNVKYLYDYLIKNSINDEYEIICISDAFFGLDKGKVNNVKFRKNGVFALYAFLTSKYFFYCFGGIPIRSSKSQVVVNLWHGMPIKKIGQLENKVKHRKLNYFDFLLSYSPFFSDVLEKSFDVTKEKLLFANAPRNAPLTVPFLKKESNEKKIVWLPTYRKSSLLNSNNGSSSSTVPLLSSNHDFYLLNETLKKCDTMLYIKLHPLQDKADFDQKLSNIKLISDSWLSDNGYGLYEFLAETDALITDYSSVSIDYILLNRPIFYVMDDEKEYKESRGLNFSDEEFMAGKKIRSIEKLYQAIEDVHENKDEYFQLRQDKRKAFFVNTKNGSKDILEKLGI